ncbi:hypothetical protein SAMN05421743_10781 [Thalassobacillus cyri]|uniref:Uncharacterized protein n=1 Tax=Thalassobacillus cyri TaxID=571932 RepID=A0A1H4DD45_9BACI|nr:hypothetical protein [Thalassobacillus cyri]SEA70537.1 hypothetical protein SAMN05421743_10781 [Thalassobacillus cyri]
MRIAKWLLIIFAVFVGGYYLYTNYGMINTEELTGVQIEKKDHKGDAYYIYVDGDKYKVKDENIWMLLDKEKNYDLTYEWYGQTTPSIKKINQTGDHDAVGGGH